MNRVGIYLRLSEEDKNKKDNNSESIKNQRNMLIDYINKNNDMLLIDEYCDEDLSGAGTYRPEFERLIKDCENHKLDIVLCKSQSRFTRDMELVEKYLHNKFNEWNIRFIGISDYTDTENLGNKKTRQINGLVNEWFLEDVSNNIRSAFRIKMIKGEYISPFASYGYIVSKKDNNKLEIDPIASIIVKKIYNLYLKGYGYTKIAKYLDDNKIPAPSLYKYREGIKLNIVTNKPIKDIKWNTSTIKRILTNELYIGNLIQGKRTTVSYKNHKIINKNKSYWIKKENTHESIINKEVFNKVQTMIKERTKPLKKGNIHILSGKVYCNICNHLMRKKNTTKHIYLSCDNNCLNKHSIRYDKLEGIVLDLINNKIKKYFDKEILLQLFNSNKTNKILEYNKEINKKIIKNKEYLYQIYKDKVNGIINEEEFKELLSTYQNKHKEYHKYLNSIIKEKDNNYNHIITKYKHFNKLNIIIIEEFIDKIHIDILQNNQRNIKIFWKF